MEIREGLQINIKKGILISFIVFLIAIILLASDEWVIKTKEFNINKPINCSISLQDIQNEIRKNCNQISSNCYLGKITWEIDTVDLKTNAKQGSLNFTFCNKLNGERYELLDVIIDVELGQINNIRRYGNKQIGLYDKLETSNLEKNLNNYLDKIKSDSELKNVIESTDNVSLRLELLDSRVNVVLFSEETSGAKIRKSI